MSKLLITTALSLLPFAAQAQSFSVPDGCEGVVTVQQRGCLMVNVWQCKADPAGDKWLALITQNGPFSIQHVDREFQWLESFKVTGNEVLVQPAPDPSSMTELLENGLDTYEFVIKKETGIERNIGFDALTDLEVEIDGEPLLQTEFEGRTIAEDGTELDHGVGHQFVSAKHRMFFFGESWDAATPDQVVDLSPVEFIYPGEAGFFAAKPKFECDLVDASFPQ